MESKCQTNDATKNNIPILAKRWIGEINVELYTDRKNKPFLSSPLYFRVSLINYLLCFSPVER